MDNLKKAQRFLDKAEELLEEARLINDSLEGILDQKAKPSEELDENLFMVVRLE